ncbi:MAG: tRNA uridine-5-carboxymethylaminomethyl(34) synthesis GTPase MnmE [Clostridia bacterium]|nr:tRNA uridine-5-carboxymethylaminomethyl(34) synthesis GTPase MnmE [Clostridia bacterium]
MKPDTIVAAATPPGTGGIGIIRLSGPEAGPILKSVFRLPSGHPCAFESHRLYYGRMMDGERQMDECMAVLMVSPKSYTREDVAEIHVHGGGWLVQEGIRLCLRRGARLAEPGEFTRRAFLNERIDLSQAEAVMSLISAESREEQDAAVRQINGGAASFVKPMSDELTSLQAGLAACIDYPEEISEEEGTGMLIPGIRKLHAALLEAIDERSSRLIWHGLQVTLFGRPNVGKSSILNALLGEDKAIVTSIPGTTRDVIQGHLTLNGVKVVITDTAGIRQTEDPVEKIGVARSEKAMREADIRLLVLDGSEELTEEDRSLLAKLDAEDAVVINKSDLPQKVREEDLLRMGFTVPCLTVSADEPDTLERIRELIRERAAVRTGLAVTQPRHLDALQRAADHLQDALETAENLTLDMVSVDLQAAQAALCEITGERADEALLDRVFSQFCVGK